MAISISNRQLEGFRPYIFENYITELVEHCDTKFPHLKKTLGEELLRKTLTDSVALARSKGITQRGPVQFYIDMLIVFGSDFENDPQYLWIKGIQDKTASRSQMDQANCLYLKVKDYLEEISGENHIYMLQAMKKLKMLNVENVSVHKNTFVADVQYLIKETYPQKSKLTTEKQMRILIEEGRNKAEQQYGFYEPNHQALIVMIMFLQGHQFDKNPFYPWAKMEATMKYTDTYLASEAEKAAVKRLEARANIWMDAAIKGYKVGEDNVV